MEPNQEVFPLAVVCPYCGAGFSTKIFDQKGKIESRGEKLYKGGSNEEIEVECLPYTRDIGRFDPKSENDYYAPNAWSRIGEDYLKSIKWQWIGILRIPPGTVVNVQYRVQHCAQCGELFDIFVNLTPGKRFAELWGYVFKPEAGKPDELALYKGISLPLLVVKKLGKWLKSDVSGAIWVGTALFVWGMISCLLPGQPSDIYPIFISSLFYFVSALSIILFLILVRNYTEDLLDSNQFSEVFKIKDRRGLIFWQNYTLCRFVGAQEEGGKPRLSQGEIVGSGLSVISLIAVWLVKQWSSFAGMNGWQLIRTGMDLMFWVIMAYFIGLAAWFAMNTAVYILKGVTRIPMKLNGIGDSDRIKPLLRIQSYSTWTILIIFFWMLFIISALIVSSQPALFAQNNNPAASFMWLEEWLTWAIAIYMAAIPIAFQKRYLPAVAVYLILQALATLNYTTTPFIHTSLILLPPRLVILGAFQTVLLAYHLNLTNSELNQIYQKAYSKIRKSLSVKAEILIQKLEVISLEEKSPETSPVTELAGLLNSLTNLQKYYDTVLSRPVRLRFRIVEIISPFLWSLFLPTIWNVTLGQQIVNLLVPLLPK